MNRGSNNTASIDLLVDQVCDGECSYIRGPQAQIPNGVLSRLPILDCGWWEDPEVDNRNFVWARIDVPGDADLWAISVHLLTESASRRDDEIDALLDEIQGAIPASDLIVLGGDLNTNSRNESGIDKLSALFETDGPYPEDHDGEDGTNAPRDKPYDWVIASNDLFPFEVPVEIGASVFAAGAVIDTRVYEPLSEIAPAQANDSAASGMQHMAVVKDFQLPAR
jgi:endonuclease/exonuclease/phosphatase family metal-dependent hydrolase